MRITTAFDDVPDFVRQVEHLVNGVIRRHSPKAVILVKINNWFGSRWLGFSGKTLGALGLWHKPYKRPPDNIRIPPFVPARVVSQRRFDAPTYIEVVGGKPIHARIPSSVALLRKAAHVAPGTALMWYSGNSRTVGRGAIMAYVPVGSSYWPWYAGLEIGDPWRITETWDIKREYLSKLMEQGSRIKPYLV